MGLFRRLTDRLFRKRRPREEKDEPHILSIYGDGQEVDRMLAEDFGLDPAWPREVLEDRFHYARQALEETGDADQIEEMIAACRQLVDQAEPGSLDFARWTTNLAISLRESADHWQDSEQLAESIELLERMRALFRFDDSNRARVLGNLAVALRSRFRWDDGDAADLDRAIQLGEDALEICPDGLRPMLLNNLANALSHRFDHSGVREDLDRSIEASREGLETAPGDSGIARVLRANLGLSLLDRSSMDDDDEERDEAMEIIEQPMNLFGKSLLEDVQVLHSLGAALLRRYVRTGDESDLQRSVQTIERAWELHTADSPNRHSELINLSAALRYRFDLSRDPNDIERAIRAAEEAIALAPEEAGAWNNLANALLQKFNLTQNGSDIEKALEASGRAAELGADEALYLNSHGVCLRTRYLVKGNATDLTNAIELFDRAAAVATVGSPERARALGNLGAALEMQQGTRSSISETYERATVEGIETSVAVGLNSAMRWGQWAFDRRDWPEAARAFGHANRAAQLLFEAQLVRASKEHSLERVQGLAADTAFALTQTGNAEGAVVALEGGLARILSQALDRGRIELHELADADPDLFMRYHAAASRVSWLLGPSTAGPHRLEEDGEDFEEPSDRTAEARAARNDLRRIVDEIRGRPGFERFLAALSRDDLQSLVSTESGVDALVYLASTSAGSLAWIVAADTVEPVPLEIDSDGVLALLGRPGEQGYLAGAAFGGDWLPNLLPELLTELRTILEPVAARLRARRARRIALVPVGLLGLLPLHAALIDELTISIVPNGASLMIALREAPSRTGSPLLLGIGNPLPSHQPLAGAESELAEIAALFPEECRLTWFGADATRDVLLAGIPRATHLHFACHGAFDAREPLQSSLELAGGRLTLQDLLEGEERPARARLAVLSACQSALTDFLSLPDEVIGFPAGFLQAGVPGVIASLWPVSDLATALLAVKFYELHLDGLPPAEALRDAQRWLRAATRKELDFFIAQHPRLQDLAAAPFANAPFAWAGFAFYGA